MSQEDVDAARELGDHWNETGDVDWDVIDPEIVFIVDPPGFLAGTYRGYGGVRALLERFAEIFDEARYEIDEIRDAGTTVVALGRWRVRGARSGAAGTQPIALVFEFRNGKLVKYRACFDRGRRPRGRGTAGLARSRRASPSEVGSRRGLATGSPAPRAAPAVSRAGTDS